MSLFQPAEVTSAYMKLGLLGFIDGDQKIGERTGLGGLQANAGGFEIRNDPVATGLGVQEHDGLVRGNDAVLAHVVHQADHDLAGGLGLAGALKAQQTELHVGGRDFGGLEK